MAIQRLLQGLSNAWTAFANAPVDRTLPSTQGRTRVASASPSQTVTSHPQTPRLEVARDGFDNSTLQRDWMKYSANNVPTSPSIQLAGHASSAHADRLNGTSSSWLDPKGPPSTDEVRSEMARKEAPIPPVSRLGNSQAHFSDGFEGDGEAPGLHSANATPGRQNSLPGRLVPVLRFPQMARA